MRTQRSADSLTASDAITSTEYDDDRCLPMSIDSLNIDNILDDGINVVIRLPRTEYDKLRNRGKWQRHQEPALPTHLEERMDVDIDELFAPGFHLHEEVPQMADEFTACNPDTIMAVHVGCMLFLIFRLVVLWHTKHASLTELLKCGGLIFTYFVLGVMMPRHAKSLQVSDALRRLLLIREAYQRHAEKHLGIRRVAKYYRIIQPTTVLLATVPAFLSFAQVFTSLDEKFSYESQPLSTFIFISGTLWFVLMACFGVAAVELVCIDASEVCVEGLAEELDSFDTPTSSMSIDWASMHRKCVKFHEILDEVWDLPSVGGLWACRVLLLFGATLVTGTISLHRHIAWMRAILRLLAAVTAAGGSYLLLRLALITLQCSDQRPNSKSLLELALKHGGRLHSGCESAPPVPNTARQISNPHDRFLPIYLKKIEYQTFMSYLQMGYIGIQVRGIVVTLPRVVMIFANMVGTFQLALFYTERVLYPDIIIASNSSAI